MGRLGFNLVRTKEKTGNCQCLDTNFTKDNEESENILNRDYHHCPCERRKKVYLLFFISTTVLVCFCAFVLVPQLIDYYTNSNVLDIETSKPPTQKQLLKLLDTERFQERLKILHKFGQLQRNYKQLQIEYQKAQEILLDKLHSARETEEATNLSTIESISNSLNQNKFEDSKLDSEIITIHEDKSERPVNYEIPRTVIVT